MQFTDLNLNNALRNALDDMGFREPTEIQHAAFAPVMAGHDVLGIAQTGTGKTLAYLMPLIRQWQFSAKKSVALLIVVPTKELVVQIEEQFAQIAAYTNLNITGVYGGPNIKTQAASIAQGVDAVVGTPGRLTDLLLNGAINPRQVKKLVIDEVDRMLSLGFRNELMKLIELLPEKRQNLMFSATMTPDVEVLIASHFPAVKHIATQSAHTPVKKIVQLKYNARNFNTKMNLLRHLLQEDESMSKVLVFAGDKHMANRIEFQLGEEFEGQLAVVHANKSSNKRLRTVEEFESGVSRILIASDVLARGLDVQGVSHVINFMVPREPEDYVHRIGRTGRADREGVAITFCSEQEEEAMTAIEALMQQHIATAAWPRGVEVSDVFLPEETDRPAINPIKVHAPKLEGGGAFHEKLDKNKKVPIKVTRADKMKAKYGKNYQSGHSNSTR
jgi:ATP-dependent RNA helicase RhlE